jgi:hypothetical protein
MVEKYLVLAALLGITGGLAGCGTGGSGKPTAHLSGAVTIDGQPPPANAVGTVTFRPTGSGQAQPVTVQITNGTYDCANVPMGNVDVFIQLVQQTGQTASEGGRQYPELRNLIADKYNSGIELNVTGDNSNQDFALTSK